MIDKSYHVFPPNCAANMHGDKWLCEVRNRGWIADWKRFDTEAEAHEWGKHHNGEMAQKAIEEIAKMAKRWANK